MRHGRLPVSKFTAEMIQYYQDIVRPTLDNSGKEIYALWLNAQGYSLCKPLNFVFK